MATHVEHFTTKLTRLRADVKDYWPAATFHSAPYKPMLILSVMDLMAQRIIQANCIKLDADLIDAFDLYWTKIIGTTRTSSPVMPFNHLRSEGFWHLIDSRGVEINLQGVDRNEIFRRIKGQMLFARLDDDLFGLLQDPLTRDELRRVLIETYFAPDVRPIVVEVGQITAATFAYSRDLLNRSRGRFTLRELPPADATYLTDVRSAAFRRVVVEAYRHTCAICRARIVTPEGRTAVAAAHIVPWSHSHNDDPRNGVALCGLHHWVFDQGLLGISAEYRILASPVLALEGQQSAALLAVAGTTMHRPVDQRLWPALPALRWHLEHIFRPAGPDGLR